ncbi:hypothetical protein [Arenibaculum pallidiluteum]|uniref:hypothetical protein n=1 Tax=Arenibaculum pallidiluteum TaxID=2812559 RepID=UPI001A9744C3|nr:hypothetical protein [Arenibaculum pallidiluteum]
MAPDTAETAKRILDAYRHGLDGCDDPDLAFSRALATYQRMHPGASCLEAMGRVRATLSNAAYSNRPRKAGPSARTARPEGRGPERPPLLWR